MKTKLSAINPVIVDNIPDGKDFKIKGKPFVNWGRDNKYPNYLFDLYSNVATLQSIINGTADFVCGDEIKSLQEVKSSNGDTLTELVRKLVIDKLIYGGFAIEVIRDKGGNIAYLNRIDISKIRSNQNNTEYYFSDDWGTWGYKYIKIPKYQDGLDRSLYFDKGFSNSVYPICIYQASVIPCEIERHINEFHLNSLNNGFTSNLIINFNNGVPEDSQKEEIERAINEKFSGYQNAGRILISYNDSETNKTTVERLDSDDFDDKYKALAERSRSQIFIAFRATPNLFGLPIETTGFNEQEYESAFRLYNRTMVKPIQQSIVNTFKKFNIDIEIKPFTIDEKVTDNTVVNN